MANKTTTMLAEILRVEPEFYKESNVQPEYEMTRGTFEGRYRHRGAYADEA